MSGRFPVFILMIALVAAFAACKSSSRSGLDILGPADETTEAAKIVADANTDLKKIKELYKKNEGKREEIKKAMQADDAEAVKKIADDVVYLINDGADLAKTALDKLRQAQDLEINPDYEEYLRLKELALTKQLEAFEHYRQAARMLRDNYDPKNSQLREKVKAEFEQRSENYRATMEKARDYSNQANELAKEVAQRQQN